MEEGIEKTRVTLENNNKRYLTRYTGEAANVLCMGTEEVPDELEVIAVSLTHGLLVDVINS